MTFKSLQDRVMDRLNLTSPEARARIKNHVNERYRRVATSIGLAPVRFGTASLVTVNGTQSYSPATVVKPLTITYPAGNRVLDEKTMDEIRILDPDASSTGAPQMYVVQKYGAQTVTLYLWPKPDAAYTLTVDAILTGTDLTADADLPVFPEDFHDVLLFGGLADEYTHQDKAALGQGMEQRFDRRLSDLRYFLAKSAYLDVRDASMSNWFWGPWFGTYRV